MPRPRVYIHRLQWLGYDEYMDPDNEALLASFADVVNDGRADAPVPPEVLVERLQGVSGILSLNGSGACDVTTEALQAAGTVRVAVISHYWHGSHDEAGAMWRAAGVEVIDESDACNEAVAEWTIGAAIAGLRRFETYDRELKSGVEWPSWRRAGQLNGSTVGLLSLGRVGRLVARHLGGFDCRVLVYDPYADPAVIDALGAELVDLDTLLSVSDVVSLHTPVLPETTGMLGAREFALIKDGAVFVNSARAAIYDGDAFRAELAKGRFTAYLDVFEPEPPPLDDPLRSMSNVVMTPHVAGTTPLMFLRCGRRAIERLRGFLGAGPVVPRSLWPDGTPFDPGEAMTIGRDVGKLEVREVWPTSEATPLEWRYTGGGTGGPWDAMAAPDFDDSDWRTGSAPFGPEEPLFDSRRNAEWFPGGLWLRRSFTLDAVPAGKLYWWLYHHDDAEVYLDGRLVCRATGSSGGYAGFPLSPLARGALKVGENLVAVHVQQEWAGQYVDVGLIEVRRGQ